MGHLYVWRWREAIIQFQVPNISSVDSEAGSLTNKWLWHLLHRLAGGHRDTQHPAASWQQNHIPILQSLVCDICIESRNQSTTPATLACWHTLAGLAKLRRVFVLLELLTASYNQLEGLIRLPTELTVNIVTLRHWVRIGTWQSWSELMLWIKMSLVTIMTIMTTR